MEVVISLQKHLFQTYVEQENNKNPTGSEKKNNPTNSCIISIARPTIKDQCPS